MRIFMPAVSTVITAMLAGCASQTPPLQPIGSTQGSTLVQKAYVTDIRDITFNDGRHAAVGSIVGAVVGGIAGSNIGAGNGRALATVGGVAAGGMAGRQVGKASSTNRVTRVTVRADDGNVASHDVESGEIFRVGEPVKVITTNGNVTITH